MNRPRAFAERAAAVASDARVADYQRDGAVCLRGLLAHALFPLPIGEAA